VLAIAAAQATSFSAQSFGIWSDQLVSAPKATVVQENGAVSLLLDEARSQYPEASTREWLQVAESAFEFWDNPIDAAYDDL
jgi:hypothetical protein